MSFFCSTAFHGSKVKYKTMTQDQLSQDSEQRIPDAKSNVLNWKDVIDWHKSLVGATQD